MFEPFTGEKMNMQSIKNYFEYAIERLNRGHRSFELFMLSRALGFDIWPVRPNGWIDAIGWNRAFAGGESNRLYYTIDGEVVGKIPKKSSRLTIGGVIVLTSSISSPVTGAGIKYGCQIKSIFKNQFKDIMLHIKEHDIPDAAKMKIDYTDVVYSYGNYFRRNTQVLAGADFNCDCLSVEVLGLNLPALSLLAMEIVKEFNEKQALIKDNADGSIFLIGSLIHLETGY